MPFKHRLFNRTRTFVSLVFLVALCVKALPSPFFFWSGLLFLLCGGAVRIWATGHIQKIERLATSGPYRHVRHPLYTGNFLIGVGFSIFSGQAVFLLLFFIMWLVFYYPLILEEEKFLKQKFPEYEQFAGSVPRFFPRSAFSKSLSPDPLYSFAQAKKNREPLTFIVILLFYLLLGLQTRVLTLSF